MHRTVRRFYVLAFVFVCLFLCGFTANVEAQQIKILSGDGQLVQVQSRSEKVVLLVHSEAGEPLANQRIALALATKPSKDKDYDLEDKFLMTNAEGKATFQIKTGLFPGRYSIFAFIHQNPERNVKVSMIVHEESWVMYLLFGLAGGLGMFLFGMQLGADGLQKIAGKKMKSILGTFTNNPYLGVITGIIVTAITQSSSATTVMLVGFVNASLMTISQTLAVIMGANIGTTVTVQLIAFDISHYALFMIGIGFLLKYSTNKSIKYGGDILLGFGFIFYGMKVMSIAMSPLRSYPAFKTLLLSFCKYPVSAIIGSMFFTALIQSSGATIGLVVVFAGQGLISLNSAVPLILGAHTGTCITGWLAAVGTSANAKKTAMLNVIYNVIGTLIFLPFLYDYFRFSDFVRFCTAPISSSIAREVANAHMISATIKVIVLFPFYNKIVALANFIVPDDKSEAGRSKKPKYLSESLLGTPELALGNVAREISRMAGHVEFMMKNVPRLLSYGQDELIQEVNFREEKIDSLQYQITKYLSRLSENSLTEEQTAIMMKYMHIINDLEGLADLIHKVIVPFSLTKTAGDIRFSEEGYRELMKMFDEVNEFFMLAINSFATNDKSLAEKVQMSETRIYRMEMDLRTSHMRRIFDHTEASLETSTLHLDLLNCFKRINAHSVDIAKALAGEWYSFKGNYNLESD